MPGHVVSWPIVANECIAHVLCACVVEFRLLSAHIHRTPTLIQCIALQGLDMGTSSEAAVQRRHRHMPSLDGCDVAAWLRVLNLEDTQRLGSPLVLAAVLVVRCSQWI